MTRQVGTIVFLVLLASAPGAAASPTCVGLPGASLCADHSSSCVGFGCVDCVTISVNQQSMFGRCVTTPTDPEELVDGAKGMAEEASRRVNIMPYVIDCEDAQTNCIPPLP